MKKRPLISLVQLVCPNGHLFLGAAWNPYKHTFESACQAMDRAIEEKRLVRRCFICKSTDLRFERTETKWRTLEEALPHLKDFEMVQLRYREQTKAERQ
jgi:hypothetical protein